VAYFPMFMELKNELCIVIGGGMVAYRKIKALLEFEAKVIVIAPEFCENILGFGNQIITKYKLYETADITEAFLVIAATNDTNLNTRISTECRELKIPVNVVDIKEECSFIFPAYIKKGAITVGVTSSGKSPIISQKIKKKIKEVIPDYMEELVDFLGDAREEVLLSFDQEVKRKNVFKQLVELGCLKQGKLTDRDVQEIIRKEKEN
jgi:precorrin-2 dehydrogenase / sirohydrochlorin ferrochelatase